MGLPVLQHLCIDSGTLPETRCGMLYDADCSAVDMQRTETTSNIGTLTAAHMKQVKGLILSNVQVLHKASTEPSRDGPHVDYCNI